MKWYDDESVGGLEPIARTKPPMPLAPRRRKDSHDLRGLSKRKSPKSLLVALAEGTPRG